MKSKREIEGEFWDSKLIEIQKKCRKNRDDSLSRRCLDLEKIAMEMLHSLREEIPTERVKAEFKEKFVDKDVCSFRVAIQFDEKVSLEFTSFVGWMKREAKECMFLYFSKASDYFYVDIRDYKTVIEEFTAFYKNYNLYCEEINPALLENEKQEKIRQTAKNTIRVLIPNFMAQTGYEWNLVEEDERAILQVKMKRAKMIEITLGYKSFTDKIPELMNVIKQMDELISAIPYPANIKSYGRNIPWKKNGK